MIHLRLIAAFLLAISCSAFSAEPFKIRVVRESVSGKTIHGKIYLNDKLLGPTYENTDVKIPEGTYPGIMRYTSGTNKVQGDYGGMANTGDFLLEVSNVAGPGGKRTDILLHGGNSGEQSQGCILLGPVSKDPEGNRFIPEDHPLRKLRLAFYGTDEPNSSPNKDITIEIASTIKK